MPPADAAQARLAALVMAGTTVVWLGLNWLGGRLDWEARWAFLFDLAAIAAFAALGALAVAIPVGFMLSVGSGPRAPETADLLRIAVVVAYLAAFAGAAWRLARRRRAPGPAA